MQSQNKTNYYEILGVSKTATQDEIKKAFRMLVKKYHPDVNPNPNANEMMKNITVAYEVLSDVEKRKEYDRQHSYESNFDSSKSYYSYNESREESESDFDEWIIDLLKKHRMYNASDNKFERLLKARKILFHSNNSNFSYASFVRGSEETINEKVKVKRRY